jgi:hypothetical protein
MEKLTEFLLLQRSTGNGVVSVLEVRRHNVSTEMRQTTETGPNPLLPEYSKPSSRILWIEQNVSYSVVRHIAHM